MKRFATYRILPALVLLMIGTALGMNLDAIIDDENTYDQLRKLENAFVVINQRYVDDVDPAEVAQGGIKGMLNSLDPHSSYISAEDIQSVQEGYEGSFGGIGIWFEMVDDTARVISPISDGPSERAGVMAGDRIIKVNDSSAVNISSEAIQNRLKGPKGTDVKMTVYRPGVRDSIDFVIERDEIPLYSVEGAHMVDDETGYIRITRFSMTTYDEFMEAMADLQAQGMERLMLDLRFNPGGVMQGAIQIADEFLSEGQSIVQTRGRTPQLNQELNATAGGSFEDKPVIVMVNQFSASASEILAGALQDHDRALIVGNRTFGKGLVQNQFPLPDGSVLQMTVARYYTPSGRLIQTPYEDGQAQDVYEERFSDADLRGMIDASDLTTDVPDSLVFRTDRGRAVFGGGGIMPDYVVETDTSALIPSVRRSGMDLVFVRDYFLEREQELRERWGDSPDRFVEEFEVPEDMWVEFWEFAEEQGLTLTADPAQVDPEEGIFAEDERLENRARLETFLKFHLARSLYGSQAAGRIELQADREFAEALQLWDYARELAAYHAAAQR